MINNFDSTTIIIIIAIVVVIGLLFSGKLIGHADDKDSNSKKLITQNEEETEEYDDDTINFIPANPIGTLISALGWLTYIAGLLLAIVFAFSLSSLALLPAVYSIVASFVSGTLFLGFGEVIQLLHRIYYDRE